MTSRIVIIIVASMILMGAQSHSEKRAALRSEESPYPEANTVFLDVFEVSVKKKDLGIYWEPPLYLSSQFLGFKKDDNPLEWNETWHEKH